jgi:hypothetical protein
MLLDIPIVDAIDAERFECGPRKAVFGTAQRAARHRFMASAISAKEIGRAEHPDASSLVIHDGSARHPMGGQTMGGVVHAQRARHGHDLAIHHVGDAQ